jgi:predicted RNA-binding protein YlxR (DUF448 family)
MMQERVAMGKKQPRRQKHIPLRTCVICREKKDKRQLTRLVRIADDGGVHVDLTGKQNGRGAYLCDNPSCWQKAIDGQVLNQALRTTLTDDDRERIRAAMPHPD